MPSSMDGLVVFDRNNIDRLHAKIAELTNEKLMQRKEYNEIKQSQVGVKTKSVFVCVCVWVLVVW